MTDAHKHGRNYPIDGRPGLYPANKTHDPDANGGYPASTENVLVHPAGPDGYHDITLLDAGGRIVMEANRPRHRIDGAIAGEPGYDIIVLE